MRHPAPPLFRQTGSGLIEVLVLILVMAIGMLSMGRIHTVIMRDAGTSNNRSIATSLAQEKIEDLRGFKWIDAASSGGENCGNGIYCFSEIVTNTGGVENADGSLVFPSGNITMSNTTFNRTWTAIDNALFKLVVVTVTWTDTNGNGSVALQSAIVREDSSITALSANGGGGISMPGPKVKYTPIGVPDVVPVDVDLGNGLKKETSKPLPDVSSKGYSIRTAFESVTYKPSGQTNIKTAQEAYATVSCVCTFDSAGEAYPASYFSTVNGKLTVKYPKGTVDGTVSTGEGTVSKIRGSVPSIQGDPQDPLCFECCRDHHDNEGPNASTPTTALYDPARPNSDYANSGNHKHYYYANAVDGSGNTTNATADPASGLTAVAETSGNKYLEACRFLRVDGFYRLMQDWRLVDTTVMPKENYLVDGSSALTAYQAYIAGVVKAQVKTDGGTTTAFPGKNTLATRDLSNQTAGLNQLLSRGIYVDKVYSATSPRTTDSSYYNSLTAKIDANQNVLDQVSFNEVNLTLLAGWRSSNTSVATVTNQEIKDIAATTSDYYGTYSRGRAQVLTGSGGNTDITADVLPSNSGLTGGSTRANYSGTPDYDSSLNQTGTIAYETVVGIDRDDHRSGVRKTDSINISRSGSGTGTSTISGVVAKGNNSGSLTNISVSGTDGASCTVASPSGSETTYSCSVPDGYAGTLTVSTSQANAYVYSTSSGSSAMTNSFSPSCTNGTCVKVWAFGPTIDIGGACSGNRCSHNSLTISAGTGAVCVKGDNPYCTVPLDTTTKSWSGTITVDATKEDIELAPTAASCAGAGGDKSSLILSNQGPTDKPGTFNMCATN
jgi:hypothetical protein